MGVRRCGTEPDVANRALRFQRNPYEKPQKVLFPDLVEHCPNRVLNDFVLPRRDQRDSTPAILKLVELAA